MKPTIWLWECPGMSLVLEAPTGVLYSNQTCGTCYGQSVIEGILIPLGQEFFDAQRQAPFALEEELTSYFTGPKYGGSGAMTGLDDEDADFIDTLLLRGALGQFLRVHRGRLVDSHEAWIHVEVVRDAGDGMFTGFGPYPRTGIISWDNSD